MNLAASIDIIIPLCAGLYMAGVGFGEVSPPIQNRGGDKEWMLRNAKKFKIIGILLITVSLIRLLIKFAN